MTSVMAGFKKLLLLVLFLLLSVNLTVGSPIQTQDRSARNPNAGGMVCDRIHRNGTTGIYDPYLQCRQAPRNYRCDIHGELQYRRHNDLCSKKCHCPTSRNHTTTAAFLDIAADIASENGKNVINSYSTPDSIVKPEAGNAINVDDSNGVITASEEGQADTVAKRSVNNQHAESEFPGTIARDVTALRLMCKDPTPHNRYLELPCASKFDYTCMYTQDNGLPTYRIYNQTCSETCRCSWRLARDLDGRGV